MELSDFLRIIRARWVSLLVVTAAGLALAGLWVVFQPKVYTADASGIVAVENNEESGSSFTNNTLATARIPSYVELGSLRSVADFAIEDLGLDTTPEALVQRVDVTNPPDTLFVRVEADAPTPEAARDLAEVWIRGMEREVNILETGSPDQEGELFLAPRDSARLPSAPSSPNVEVALVLGLAFGLAGGLTYALVRHQLDRRVRSPQDVEDKTGASVIGTIPVEDSLTADDRLIIDPSTGGSSNGVFAISEALRSLRTNIQFTDIDNPPKVVVVTSPLPGDGKSTIAANLAMTIAASGQHTILVDADLRKPMQSNIFNLPSGAGLTDVLAGRVQLTEAVHSVGETGRLLVVGAGSIPPNPSEILGSQRMKDLLAMMTNEAFVIIDAPPVVPVTDAAVLSTVTDGAIVVATVGTTTFDALTKALDNLRRVKGRPLGVVLNRVPRKGQGAAYYGYQYSGDYYLADDEGIKRPRQKAASGSSDSRTRRRTRDSSTSTMRHRSRR